MPAWRGGKLAVEIVYCNRKHTHTQDYLSGSVESVFGSTGSPKNLHKQANAKENAASACVAVVVVIKGVDFTTEVPCIVLTTVAHFYEMCRSGRFYEMTI